MKFECNAAVQRVYAGAASTTRLTKCRGTFAVVPAVTAVR